LAAKDAIRLLLKKRHGLSVYPADVEITAGNNGEPVARVKCGSKITSTPIVSIAHSDGTAVAVATDDYNCRGLGIDVERDSKKHGGLEIAMSTEEERTLLESFEPKLRKEWLIRVWCAKEAVAKALRRGLLDGPGSLLAKHLDLDTGAVKLKLVGTLAEHFPEITGTLLTARTAQESGSIFATATLERS
jgi:4'-phosphopantetheinyl transferase EntD